MREEQTSWNLDRGRVMSALREARSGRGTILLYEGAPETGKTWVLDEALRLAADAGFTTVRVRVEDEPVADPASGRDLTAVVIDDVHRASPTVARTLRSLTAAERPVLWVLARESGAGCSEVERLCRAIRARSDTGGELVPWTEDETNGYLTERLHATPDPALTRLAGTAGGNPALLETLVDGLSEEEFVEVSDGRARLVRSGLPDRVLRSVRERLLRTCREQLVRDAITLLTDAALPAGDHVGVVGRPQETVTRATRAWRCGALSRGLRLAQQTISESRRLAGQGAATDVEFAAAVLLADASRFDQCDEVLEAIRARMTRAGRTGWEGRWSGARAHCLMRAGRLGAAVSALDSRPVAELAPSELVIHALAALRDGDVAKSARYVRRAKLAGGRPAEYGWVALQLAEAQHGPEHARSLLAETYGTDLRLRDLLVHEPAAAPFIVRAALACDERSTAQWVCRLISDLADGLFPAFRAAEAHAHGLLHQDPGQLSRARRLYPDIWSRARVAEDIADLAHDAAGGGQSRARLRTTGALQEALSLYSEAAAARDFARVRSRLRSVGVYDTYARFGGASGTTFVDLTSQQERIVRLVADGLTNQQIADQMFVSSHTVNFHLRSIFRKIGVNSRVELAARYKSWATTSMPRSG
ncbi:LuxR C-terminal-related transcriptional regulator [Micromonospora tulbaghiae]|uniref:LuxR C-terminal-related transcriptional regulator n=1 Tax=Micromonospora tulbaghiae TaxID=479978 RepID=UPI00365EBEB9